jgi:hypothetical protein
VDGYEVEEGDPAAKASPTERARDLKTNLEWARDGYGLTIHEGIVSKPYQIAYQEEKILRLLPGAW